MSNDFNNVNDSQEVFQKPVENITYIKNSSNTKPQKMVRFIITKNKNNSWIDDINAQAQLNQAKRVFN